jgi:hypothetical protein
VIDEQRFGVSPSGGRLKAELQNEGHEMKSLTEVVASLLLALIVLRVSGSLFNIIYEWKLRAGKF